VRHSDCGDVVRCWYDARVADGWADAVKPLFVQLLHSARGCVWLDSARASTRRYRELYDDSPESCARRMEFITTSYFENARNHYKKGGAVRPFPQFKSLLGGGAPPLVVQLVRYGLFACTDTSDAYDGGVWSVWRSECGESEREGWDRGRFNPLPLQP